ncbi:MAG: hypothetical protein ABIP42_08345 [Planctomycetota bacterium]
MKLILSPFLSLLLVACASDASTSKSQPPSEPVASQPMEKVAPPETGVTPVPSQPAADPAKPDAAPGQPAATAAQLGAGSGATPPAQPPVPAQIVPPAAPGAAPSTELHPQPPSEPATAKPIAPSFAVQMPTTPPTPCPVVLAPASKVDAHSLSGSHLGGPIKVFDKVIDEEMIRRYLCYGVGSKHIDSLKFDVICRGEIAKRKAAGEDVSKLTVSDAEVEKSIEKMRKDFLIKYPSLDFPTEVGRAYLALDVYVSELRPAILFDKTFFPEDPATWPGVTTEAIIMASGGRGFIDDSIESYGQRKQMMIDQQLDEIPADDPILTDTLRSWLLEALNQFAQVEIDPSKLPDDTLLMVDGSPIKVSEVWTAIAPHVTWENVDETRRFLTQLAVVEHDLAQHGVLMTQPEFEANFAPNRPFRDALTDYEMVAIVLQGFPSMQSCLRYERMQRSYRNLIKDEIASDAQLIPYLQRANQIAGAAKIDAEVILSSAYDFPNSRWKVDGWKSAEAKARELKAKLDAGADWGDLLELYSEFWDPPMPEVGQKPQFGFVFKGRFGEQTRNQLAGDMLETDYSTFVRGRCLADEIFFDQQGGTISDVKQGPRGYYISRVNSRKPASAGLNLQQPANREFLLNYVCMQRFGAYARQLLTDAIAKGDVKGF